MTTTKTTLAALAALLLAGCQTVFQGAAKVENGPRGCWDQCQAWGMDLAGMVKMGEYSDGCICQVRPPPPPQGHPPPQGGPRSDATMKLDGPAVAGVWMQMQAAAAQAAQAQAFQHQQQQRSWGGYGPGGSHR